MCAGSLKATAGCPDASSRWKPVARTGEPRRETQSETIPHPVFVRTLPIVDLASCKEEAYPQNFTVEQPQNNISELRFDKFPMPSTFQYWQTSFGTEVCSGSSYASAAMRWKKEVAIATTVDDLKKSRSIFGTTFPNFEMLDAKIATALKKIIQNSNNADTTTRLLKRV